ncbi:unnamed protein product [Microthlaspi erraticum]|uniref:Uncharacterized protein n=1 Tax=Microthlaspi erraticum TaxID=1685480 RepID=A0A6D2JKQ9_9BRAS|nr:unnamed protein product [Microthlaspi erraticum]
MAASHCIFEPPEFSDHSPGHVKYFTPPPTFETRPFKFFNFVTKLPSFLPCIKEAWLVAGETAQSLKTVGYKLKTLKPSIKTLCKEKFSDLENRVLQANTELKDIQLRVLNNPTTVNMQLERSARDKWLQLRLVEESFFRQRSRIKWLAEGDFDTRFFHLVTKARNAANAIKYLKKPDGSRTSSLQEVHLLAQSYYGRIYNTLKGDFCPFLDIFLNRTITK